MEMRRNATRILLTWSIWSAMAAVAAAATDLRDIRGPLQRGDFPPFALTVLALLLAAVCIFLVRRPSLSRGETQPVAVSPPLPADGLSGLFDEYLRGLISVEELFTRLEALVSGEVVGSSGTPVSCLTTAEILLRAVDVVPTHEGPLLTELMQFCDRVRFAGYLPSEREVRHALESAGRIISGCGVKKG
jgi:hypothetical protein